MSNNKTFDALIVGGSYAGLSAAMALGRSLRSVLIIDSNQPCNRQTPHAHDIITQDGNTPQAITKAARKQTLQYPTVEFTNDLVTAVTKVEKGFTVDTATLKSTYFKKRIFQGCSVPVMLRHFFARYRWRWLQVPRPER